MKNRLVGIIGPYRAATVTLVEENVSNAAAAARAVVGKLGCLVYCPHTHRHDLSSLGDDYWLRHGRYMAGCCDAVLAIHGWQHSEGTQAEITAAREAFVPVCYNLEQLKQRLDAMDG